jgi:hypothetical protein
VTDVKPLRKALVYRSQWPRGFRRGFWPLGYWCSELSSGLYCIVKWLSTDVSEVRTASIIRDELGYWYRGFKSRSRHGRLSSSVCVVLPCVDWGLATDRPASPSKEFCQMSRINVQTPKQKAGLVLQES